MTDGLDALTGVRSGYLCLAPRSDVTSCRGCMWQRSTSDESERSFDLRQFGAPRLSIVERTPHGRNCITSLSRPVCLGATVQKHVKIT